MNLNVLKMGKIPFGIFELDHEKRIILSVDIIDDDRLETNFPGGSGPNFSYFKLEKIMKAYMRCEDSDTNLECIMKQIDKEGFFFGLRPALTISVE